MTVERFVEPMTLGFTRDEVAGFYGVSPGEVSAAMSSLRAEIRAQLGEH